jgi:hypothetical protein
MSEVTLEKIGPVNLAHCGIGCVTNPGHRGHQPKVEWLRNRFAEGLRILLLRKLIVIPEVLFGPGGLSGWCRRGTAKTKDLKEARINRPVRPSQKRRTGGRT